MIVELCHGTSDDEIRNTIKLYTPEKTSRQLYTSYQHVNQPVLIKTLTYLNVLDRKDHKKESNIEAVICRIQNLLPETCNFCLKSYAAKNTDKNFLSCFSCGQEAHLPCVLNKLGINDPDAINSEAINRLINPFNIETMHYFCTSCNDAAFQKEDSGLKKSAKKKKQTVATPPPPDAHVSEHDNTNQDVTVTEQNQVVALSEGANGNNDNMELNPTDNSEEGTPKSFDKLCHFFKNGSRCKHGMSGKKGGKCKYLHPKVCQRILTYGKCNRKDCDKYHPSMCYDSLNYGECHRNSCKYWHKKGSIKNANEDPRKTGSKTDPMMQRSNEGNYFPPLNNNNNFLEDVRAEIKFWQEQMFKDLTHMVRSMVPPPPNLSPPVTPPAPAPYVSHQPFQDQIMGPQQGYQNPGLVRC